MKKVLIISYSYPPSNVPAALRPYTLAKYLSKDKYLVNVITCSNAESSLGKDNNFDPMLPKVNLFSSKSWLGNKSGGLRVEVSLNNKSRSNRIKSSLFKALSKIVYPDKAIFWFHNANKDLANYHSPLSSEVVIFTTSPLFTNHLLGLFLKRKNRESKWIVDFRDFHSFGKSLSIRSILNRMLEKKVLMNCNYATFISDKMCSLYKEKYPAIAHKMHTVYNGIDKADFDSIPILKVQADKLIIFYAGSFYSGVRSPFPLLLILDALSERNALDLDDVTVRIAGSIDQDTLDQMLKYKSSKCIEYLGKISRAQVLKEMVKSSFLWLIVGNEITHYTGVPIKFYEYLASRRPILNFAPSISEPTSIIEKYNLGWNINTLPFILDDAINIIEEAVTKWQSSALLDPLLHRDLEKFDRKHQAEIFEMLFEKTS